MTRPRAIAWLVAAALVAVYGVRAADGWRAGLAHSRGRRAWAEESYARAAAALDRAAVGQQRAADLWYAGQSRLYLQAERAAAGAADPELAALVSGAFRNFSEAISRSPASGWYWAALGDVYELRERRARARRGIALDLFDQPPAQQVGRDGRVAVGMLRRAIEREPTLYAFHDQIALLWLEYGLREPALAAVREAARVQPLFHLHDLAALDPLPEDLLDAFAAGSREALDRAPMLRRVDHRIALGRVELMRHRYDDAAREFSAALAIPARRVQRAEAAYHLGEARERLAELDGAVAAYRQATTHPVFRPAAIAGLARIAERRGDLAGALTQLHELRQLEPGNLGHLLRFAAVAQRAGRPDEAAQALEWAIVGHPADPTPQRQLVELWLATGDVERAAAALERLERAGLAVPDLPQLRQAVDTARRR